VDTPIPLLSANDFRSPVTAITTSLLSNTVATPTVKAIRGTADMLLLKNRALAKMVSYASVLIRVLEASDDPEYGYKVLCRWTFVHPNLAPGNTTYISSNMKRQG
jgi:hypothetical protein